MKTVVLMRAWVRTVKGAPQEYIPANRNDIPKETSFGGKSSTRFFTDEQQFFLAAEEQNSHLVLLTRFGVVRHPQVWKTC